MASETATSDGRFTGAQLPITAGAGSLLDAESPQANADPTTGTDVIQLTLPGGRGEERDGKGEKAEQQKEDEE